MVNNLICSIVIVCICAIIFHMFNITEDYKGAKHFVAAMFYLLVFSIVVNLS